MTLPQKREDFDDFYILCEDVGSYDFAFKDCSFNEAMVIMLKLNNNRNNEFRMELCSVNPHATEDNGMFLFSVGVQVVDGTANGYADIHYSETLRKQFPIDLTQVRKKRYGEYEFYSDADLAVKGIEAINENFDIQLVPSEFLSL